MMSRGAPSASFRSAAGAGAVVLALHALGAAGLLDRCARPSLALEVPAEAAALVLPDGRLPDDARLPAGLAARATRRLDGAPYPSAAAAAPPLAPGGHRLELETRFRGGFVERVGRTVLAGPFQDPAAPPCGVRLTLGQQLLDGLGPLLVAEVERGLGGQFGFEKVVEADLRFVAEPAGIAVRLVLRFSRGKVPIDIRLTPVLDGGKLSVSADVAAKVQLSSRVLAGAVSLFGQNDRLNRLVTDVATSEVDKVLGPVGVLLAEPPPVPLGDGRVLRLAYCAGAALEAVHGRSLTVPLAVPLTPLAARAGPILLPARPPPGPPDGALALDVSLDAVNAVLHEAWASGQLDLLLARAGLEARFNDSDAVRELLTLRAGVPRLVLPPTLTPSRPLRPERPLTLVVEAELVLHDGALATPARLFGRVDLDLRSAEGGPDAGTTRALVEIVDLGLTCLPRAGRLTACYPLLVERARDAAPILHAPMQRILTAWFDDLVSGRSVGGAAGAPTFVIDGARLSPRIDPESGWLRVDVRGHLLH